MSTSAPDAWSRASPTILSQPEPRNREGLVRIGWALLPQFNLSVRRMPRRAERSRGLGRHERGVASRKHGSPPRPKRRPGASSAGFPDRRPRTQTHLIQMNPAD
jgi:hypothetical protein